jgi:hypothetical protein
VRLCIVLAFLGLFAMGLYGSTQITQGFDTIDLVPDDSYARAYIENARRLELFSYEQNSPVDVIVKDAPYHLQATQEDILRIQTDFLLETKHNKGPFTSWLSSFLEWTPTGPYAASANAAGYITDKTTFYTAVQYFLQQPENSRFQTNVNMANSTAGDASTLTIESSRVTAFHHGLTDYRAEISAMQDTRSLMKSAVFEPKPIAVCGNYIQTETDLIIVDEMIANLGLALVVVALVSLFVLIRPGAVVVVVALVAGSTWTCWEPCTSGT